MAITISAVPLMPPPDREPERLEDLFDRPNWLWAARVRLRDVAVDAGRGAAGLIGILDADDDLGVVISGLEGEEEQPGGLP